MIKNFFMIAKPMYDIETPMSIGDLEDLREVLESSAMEEKLQEKILRLLIRDAKRTEGDA